MCSEVQVLKGVQTLLALSCPPPLAGQTLAGQMLVDAFNRAGLRYHVINLSAQLGGRRRFVNFAWRATDIIRVWSTGLRLSIQERGNILFYLQLGQSPRAMLRDLPLLRLARLRGWPTVLHVHGDRFRSGFDAAPRILQIAIQKEIAYASRIVVLSPSLAFMFHGLVDATRIVDIPNGVQRQLQDLAQQIFRSRPSTGPLRVLYLSNLIGFKGYGTVLEAARLAEERGMDHRFILAGQVTSDTKLDPTAFLKSNGLSNTEVVGPAHGAKKLELLRDADVFVLPSAHEGQPIAILEAFHFGLPIVTTPLPGIRDIVDERVNGLFVPVGDAERLLAAIDELACFPELRKCMRENNLRVAAQYSEDHHQSQMLSLFEEVVAAVQ